MPSVDFRSVSKEYGRGQRAVSDVSLHVENGEFLVLVGPSGCGKSTLLRMVAGLDLYVYALEDVGVARIGLADLLDAQCAHFKPFNP